MINAFVGKPGMGKTYSMVKLAINALDSGRDVYSNFFIDYQRVVEHILKMRKRNLLNRLFKYKKPIGKIYFWKHLNDLIDIRHGEILMDEAQIYINAREFRSLPPEFQYKAQQHRKQGLNFWFGVQNIKRIDVVARELVNSIFEMKRLGGYFFLCREFDIDDIDKAKRHCYSIRFYRLDKKVAVCYDTLQEIKNFDCQKIN